MIKIVVDCFGGDHSPDANVEGAIRALNETPELALILTGDEAKIKALLSKFKYDEKRLSVVHAPDVIECNEAPTLSLFHKKESSLVKAMDILKDDPEVGGFVSLGSTGAILAGAVLKVGKIEGVHRPGFCPILPTMNHDIVGVCDSGASADCTPDELLQFGIMGSLYLQKAYGKEKPRVALLNNGTEEGKGDNLRKAVYPLLKDCQYINFVGNMESRDFLSGNYDLVVADGFSGNVLLKSTEGTAMEMLKLLKRTFMSSLRDKIGALFLKKDIYKIKDFMDYNNYGGAVMLGVKKTVVKGHGSSKAVSVYHCILQAYSMEKNHLCDAIAKSMIVEPKQ
jgi:glycerol-3-phosphate acyltransferase PlsX